MTASAFVVDDLRAGVVGGDEFLLALQVAFAGGCRWYARPAGERNSRSLW